MAADPSANPNQSQGPAREEAAADIPPGIAEKDAAGAAPAGPLTADEIEALLNSAGLGKAGPEGRSSTPSDVATAASSSGGGQVRHEEIEQLLNHVGAAAPTGAPQRGGMPEAPQSAPAGAEGSIREADVESLLNQAQQALESIDAAPSRPLPPGVAPFRFEEFATGPASNESATLDLISDVPLDVKIELGRANMYLEDVLKLRKGAVVPLDKLAGDPVDIYVNDRLIARGEVLVLNDNFCVRVGELLAGSDLSR